MPNYGAAAETSRRILATKAGAVAVSMGPIGEATLVCVLMAPETQKVSSAGSTSGAEVRPESNTGRVVISHAGNSDMVAGVTTARHV